MILGEIENHQGDSSRVRERGRNFWSLGSARMLIFGSLFLTQVTVAAWAWGPVGHETIADIAQDNLTTTTQDKISQLLGAGTDLADISNWADEIRDEGRYDTASWHFIDLPIRKNVTKKDESDYFRDGNCIVERLRFFEGILGDPTRSRSQRIEALKFVVHFVGDIHQPLHCANDSDSGGNDKWVRFKTSGGWGRGTKIRLHALWDRLIEIHTQEDPRSLAHNLERQITDEDKIKWENGTGKDWAFESYEIAKTVIYLGMEAGPQDYTAVALPMNYYARMRPVVDQQLEKAGIRLAWVLNRLLGS